MECLSDCTAQEKIWIEGCAQHKAVAQEKLFKHFFGFAMGICLRYLPDRALAQEALNDAFLKIFNQLPYEYKTLSSFRAWARKLIIHTAIDYFRKKKAKYVYMTVPRSTIPYFEKHFEILCEDFRTESGIMASRRDRYTSRNISG